jgi:hypothetical protein
VGSCRDDRRQHNGGCAGLLRRVSRTSLEHPEPDRDAAAPAGGDSDDQPWGEGLRRATRRRSRSIGKHGLGMTGEEAEITEGIDEEMESMRRIEQRVAAPSERARPQHRLTRPPLTSARGPRPG